MMIVQCTSVPDSFHHVEPHSDTALGVILSSLWQSRDTVVTVSQDLDTKTVVALGGREERGREGKRESKGGGRKER